MASASFRISLALGETGGAAFVRLHFVLARVLRLKVGRFPGAGLGSEATAKFLKLAFAVTGMTFSLATCRVNLDEGFVFGGLRRRRGLWDRFTVLNCETFCCLQGVRPPAPVNNSRIPGYSAGGNKIVSVQVSNVRTFLSRPCRDDLWRRPNNYPVFSDITNNSGPRVHVLTVPIRRGCDIVSRFVRPVRT
jgi:hypothetical protein